MSKTPPPNITGFFRRDTEYKGPHILQTFLKKEKSGGALSKVFGGLNRRFFTINMQNFAFYYTPSNHYEEKDLKYIDLSKARQVVDKGFKKDNKEKEIEWSFNYVIYFEDNRYMSIFCQNQTQKNLWLHSFKSIIRVSDNQSLLFIGNASQNHAEFLSPRRSIQQQQQQQPSLQSQQQPSNEQLTSLRPSNSLADLSPTRQFTLRKVDSNQNKDGENSPVTISPRKKYKMKLFSTNSIPQQLDSEEEDEDSKQADHNQNQNNNNNNNMNVQRKGTFDNLDVLEDDDEDQQKMEFQALQMKPLGQKRQIAQTLNNLDRIESNGDTINEIRKRKQRKVFTTIKNIPASDSNNKETLDNNNNNNSPQPKTHLRKHVLFNLNKVSSQQVLTNNYGKDDWDDDE